MKGRRAGSKCRRDREHGLGPPPLGPSGYEPTHTVRQLGWVDLGVALGVQLFEDIEEDML
jgi:hypothetical protein